MSDAENLRELAAVLATVLAQSKATRITAEWDGGVTLNVTETSAVAEHFYTPKEER